MTKYNTLAQLGTWLCKYVHIPENHNSQSPNCVCFSQYQASEALYVCVCVYISAYQSQVLGTTVGGGGGGVFQMHCAPIYTHLKKTEKS